MGKMKRDKQMGRCVSSVDEKKDMNGDGENI